MLRRALLFVGLAAVVTGAASSFVACSGGAGDEDGSAAALASADGGSAGTTPIALASAWVDGFYDGGARGVNAYDNTNVAGADGGYFLQFAGEGGATAFANVTDCSSFSDLLLRRSYGWTPPTKQVRAHADDYYWAIRNGDHFVEITRAADVRVGDVMALLYPAGSSDTGHVAWVAAAPTRFQGAPSESGLSQYVLTVIDSNDIFYDGVDGPSTQADTRYLGYLEGGAQCSTSAQCVARYGQSAVCSSSSIIDDQVCAYLGVGRGSTRLYVDASGAIAGYTRSPNPESTYVPRPDPLPVDGGLPSSPDIVIGRYQAP